MLVATHRPESEVPSDDFHLPVHVGHALDPVATGHQPDDVGDNISHLNRSYCELTALYWAWKNLDSDVVGLSHYRRYFRGSHPGPAGKGILSRDEATALLASHDLVLPRPRNYYVETIESHYRNGHHGRDLDILRDVVADLSAAYLPAYDRVFGGRRLSLYNMLLTRRDVLDAYAAWLFPLLAATSARIGDQRERTDYQQRTVGYLGERLLNVWATHHGTDLRIAHRSVVNTQGEPRLRKAAGLVRRKVGAYDPVSRTR